MTPEKQNARSIHGISEVSSPLHPAVQSEGKASRLVKRFLDLIQEEDPNLGHADVLQAMAIATAIRFAVAEANSKPGVELAIELPDVATDSLTRANIESAASSLPSVQ